MGTQFNIDGIRPDYEAWTGFVHVNNQSGAIIGDLLGIDPLGGMAEAPELERMIDLVLGTDHPEDDDQRPPETDTDRVVQALAPGRAIMRDRRVGQTQDKLVELKKLCQQAGEAGVITWG